MTLPVVWLVPRSMFCVVPVNATLPPTSKLPVAPIQPVTLAPSVLNTATFDVPPIEILALPPEVPILASLVPLKILFELIPVNADPLPSK